MSRCWLALFVAALLAVPAYAEPPTPPTTWLLTRLHANELLMLKSVRLRNRASGKDVVIGRGSKPVLIEVEPGAYYLRRIDTGYFNVASMRVPEPELYFELQPGRVNYIGDLVIALTERPHLNVSWDFAASEETLREAAARQPGAFREPALWVRPGVEPVPIVLELEQPQVPAGESN